MFIQTRPRASCVRVKQTCTRPSGRPQPSQRPLSNQATRRRVCLLLVVVFAVKFPFSEVTAGGERLLTHGALQTLLVPRRVVDSHQEAVGDGPLASFTHGGMVTVRAWKTEEESGLKCLNMLSMGKKSVHTESCRNI